MTLLTMALHPNEETLSRLADQSELERMHSRAGRHLARCAACTESVAALLALGDAARAIRPMALPPTLLARIEAGRASGAIAAPGTEPLSASPAPGDQALGTTPPAGVGSARSGGAPAHSRHWITRRRGAVLAAAASIALVALLWPTLHRRILAAATHGEATIFPRYPRPGATIGVRFVPGPRWTGGDSLWVEGDVDLRVPTDPRRRLTEVSVAAVLLRERDGSYRGRMTLPDEALSGMMRVKREPVGAMGGYPVAEIVLLTSDTVPHRPSLDALESAGFHGRSFMSAGRLADAFAHWAPDHPMRWVVAPSPTNVGGIDWLRFFDSGERRFARLTTRLNAMPDARPGELAAMAALAYRLEEPEAAARWTERLVAEHPESPWALAMRGNEIHEMELRSAPRDSIARLIPSLDTLYERSGGRIIDLYTIRAVVGHAGDSATIRRWELRDARAGRRYFGWFFGRMVIRDPAIRDSLEAFARELLAIAPPSDSRFSLLERARAYSVLASVALARENYRQALVLADSAEAGKCSWFGQDTRGVALLALGDTAAAVPNLAAFGNYSRVFGADSARRMLGSYFNPIRWQQAVDSVSLSRRSCRRQAQ